MSKLEAPLVSIGLPIFNGANFLETTLPSLINQSYKNLEIIICDNASTDATQTIVEKFADRDKRIKYHRHDKNYGAAMNYNSTFENSTGKYFKWAAHDDALDDDYITRCVDVMENDASVVLVQPRTGQIDEHGNETGHEYVKSQDVISDNITGYTLYKTLIQDKGSWTRIFGLIRSDVLRDTPLIDSYIGSDLTLLGELGLRGNVRDIDKILFWRREHGNTSTTGQFKSRRSRWVWFDSSNKPRISLPEWRLNTEMIKSISRQDVPFSCKLRCYTAVFGRMWLKKKLLVQDLIYATTDLIYLFQRRFRSNSETF